MSIIKDSENLHSTFNFCISTLILKTWNNELRDSSQLRIGDNAPSDPTAIIVYVELEARISLALQILHVYATTSLQWSESNTDDSAFLSMSSILIGAYFSSICGGKGGLKLERLAFGARVCRGGHFRDCTLGCSVLTLALAKGDPEY